MADQSGAHMEEAIFVAVAKGGLAETAGQQLAVAEADEAVAGAHVAAPFGIVLLLDRLQVNQDPATAAGCFRQAMQLGSRNHDDQFYRMRGN